MAYEAIGRGLAAFGEGIAGGINRKSASKEKGFWYNESLRREQEKNKRQDERDRKGYLRDVGKIIIANEQRQKTKADDLIRQNNLNKIKSVKENMLRYPEEFSQLLGGDDKMANVLADLDITTEKIINGENRNLETPEGYMETLLRISKRSEEYAHKLAEGRLNNLSDRSKYGYLREGNSYRPIKDVERELKYLESEEKVLTADGFSPSKEQESRLKMIRQRKVELSHLMQKKPLSRAEMIKARTTAREKLSADNLPKVLPDYKRAWEEAFPNLPFDRMKIKKPKHEYPFDYLYDDVGVN